MNPRSWKSDVLCLGILVRLCLLTGVHQARKSALIGPDGVFYIGLGPRLPGDYVGGRPHVPPGYRLILWVAHEAATLVVGHDSSMLWLYSVEVDRRTRKTLVTYRTARPPR